MTDAEIKGMIEEATGFPSLSPLALEVAQMTTDLSAPVQEVADKIKSDAGLLAKLLSVVNCPFMGLAEPVEDVAQAISLLGYKKLCNLAVAVSIIDLFPKKQEGGFDYARYWERAVTCGVAAGEIASRIPGDFPGEPFSSGMLQDLGVLFLILHRPMDYGMSLGVAKNKGVHRTTMYTPAVTIVAAWISALTGDGPSMASGNQTCNGN